MLTDKFAKTENNQARALAQILNETVFQKKPQPKKEGADFGGHNKQFFSKQIRDLKNRANASTIKEAVDKGFITKEEGDVLLKSLSEHYAKAFADEIRIANKALNEIFGYGFRIKTRDYKGKSRVIGETLRIYP